MEGCNVIRQLVLMLCVGGMALGLASCGNDPGTRAVTGGLLGAGTGAAVGAATGGHAGTGALIGGGVGAVGGAVTSP
jgi:osmotically inducible lipoprotein OsmB